LATVDIIIDMNSRLDLHQLSSFLAVVETMHFGRAARQLGVASPNLSRQIKNIENILGYPLFERTTRGIALTAAGSYLAQRAQLLRTNFQEAIDTTRRIGRGEEGNLTIGYNESVIYSGIGRVIEHFSRRFPRVSVQLRNHYVHEQIPLLLDGTLDIGLVRDGHQTQGLTTGSILREKFVAVLPKNHAMADHTSIMPRALKDERFVLFPQKIGRLLYRKIISVCETDGFTPNITQEASEWATVITLVGAGMGVSLAPASTTQQLKITGVAYRPLLSKVSTCVEAWTQPGLTNPTARAFLTIAKEQFGPM
jgi:DNA-binding transcriptional LysR family regulator